MPKAIAPSVAHINIARFNKSAIEIALARLGDECVSLRQRLQPNSGRLPFRLAGVYAIVAEDSPR